MRFRTLSKPWSVAGMLALGGGCSIFTNLSDLTSGDTTSTGTGGRAATGSAGASTASTTSQSSGTGASDAGCSGVNVYEDPATSHCYFYDLSGTVDRFSDARTKCKAWGGDLVAIETKEEATFLFTTVNLQKDTWIGLSDLVTANDYVWVTGEPLTYIDWGPGYPNDDMGTLQCIDIGADLLWQNAPCGSTNITLCERP